MKKSINLVIVESPAKAKVIENYLGKEFKVMASFGHIRDLPKSRIGVDTDNNFAPDYIVSPKVRKRANELIEASKNALVVYLATDLDREGEAIAWHLSELIKNKYSDKKIVRITFSEITKNAILSAVKHPRDIDINLVDAQQGRRVLDRLFGYSLSPLLWQKIKRGLSAGRVQSVALKIIVDKEREIEAFVPVEYWPFTIHTNNKNQDRILFDLYPNNTKNIMLKNEEQALNLKALVEKSSLEVASIDQKQLTSNPLPPFITSTLQRAAYSHLGYSAKRTMTVAQKLYEAGHITYMRTDSLNLSQESVAGMRDYITLAFGKGYLSQTPRVYKSKQKGAQEAHEAIRPTVFNKNAQELKIEDGARLYDLIRTRAIASQMSAQLVDQVVATIKVENYSFRAVGKTIKFDGYTKIYTYKKDEDIILPELSKGESLTLVEVETKQKFSSPPSRYSEATLIKVLESLGVGRPSTYAPTISTLVDRGYIISQDKKLVPEKIGLSVNKMLEDNFSSIVDVNLTAKLEQELDAVSLGKDKWQKIVADFYNPLAKDIENKKDSIERIKVESEQTGENCPECKHPLVIRSSRYGKFVGCSNYPECRYIKKEALEKTNVKCPECKKGEIVAKKTRKGRVFYGCDQYPDCKYASWTKP